MNNFSIPFSYFQFFFFFYLHLAPLKHNSPWKYSARVVCLNALTSRSEVVLPSGQISGPVIRKQAQWPHQISSNSLLKSLWLQSFISTACLFLWAPPQKRLHQKALHLAAIHQHSALSLTVQCCTNFFSITAKCGELSSHFSWMESLLSQPKAN